MAINITGDVGFDLVTFKVKRRASDNKCYQIGLPVKGVDSLDSNAETNNQEYFVWEDITPIDTVTQAIADSALTSARATDVGNGNTLDEELAAKIAAKQGADTEEVVVYTDLS